MVSWRALLLTNGLHLWSCTSPRTAVTGPTTRVGETMSLTVTRVIVAGSAYIAVELWPM
jgi:hypothetical protein